jgi:hypothetical protein
MMELINLPMKLQNQKRKANPKGEGNEERTAIVKIKRRNHLRQLCLLEKKAKLKFL